MAMALNNVSGWSFILKPIVENWSKSKRLLAVVASFIRMAGFSAVTPIQNPFSFGVETAFRHKIPSDSSH